MFGQAAQLPGHFRELGFKLSCAAQGIYRLLPAATGRAPGQDDGGHQQYERQRSRKHAQVRPCHSRVADQNDCLGKVHFTSIP